MGREQVASEGVILRAVPYGDADLIVTLYTRDFGRLSALGRAARKSKRRFGGALDMFTLSEVALRRARSSELWTLESAQPRRSYSALALDVGTFAHASYGTELVRELSPVEAPDEPLLELLLALYEELERDGAHAQVLRAFELALLDALGMAPVLDRCAACGRSDVGARAWLFDPGRGGLCCPTCGAMSRSAGVRPLSAEAREVLLQAQRVDSLAHARELAPEPEAAAEARDALITVILGHVGKPLRSLAFIAKMSGHLRARGEEAAKSPTEDSET
ncbi:DNA repair protein RecO [Haliangium ochraceum]|uniref:DNA repair protein RecO n=1 Tax=Haliangium ochraceum (strain DSM 14365 / JCM 11303 / SMP-2) TaxID=502025 RepID=D0LWC9_HALO1|nr:DNA repair protein RecO [Haliangium ochraceum]ACY16061.1 DNA repair protein RecO [Haliangium ochraceum DSM 14365]